MVVRSQHRTGVGRRTWINIGIGAALLSGAAGVASGATVALAQPAILTAAASAPAAPSHDVTAAAIAQCSSASDFAPIAGQGPLCQADRSFVVKLANSRRVTVAPPDSFAALKAVAPSLPHSTAALVPEQCAPAGSPRIELFYAHFAGETDNYAAHVADIQQMFRDVDTNYIAYDASQFYGMSMHLYVECDGSGNPVVHDVGLSTPIGSSNFSTIASDMQSQGYDQNYVHYWIWTDGNPVAAYGYAGQSSIQEDDSSGAGNTINTAYEYSVNYGYTDTNYGPQVFAHENGHAMGAVQLSAPDSTGAFHCTDGLDVMCYDDGGPRGSSYTPNDCNDAPNGTALFDCHADDYFNPNPAAGSYLATHWNLGSTNNHWIYFGPVPSTTTLAESASTTVYTQPLTLRATISSAAGPAASGTVTFLDGSSTIGTAQVSGGAAQLTVTTLGLGTHTLSASFGGSGFVQSSTSTTVSDTVSEASTSTAVASSANPAGMDVPFTLTATVSPVAPAAGAPDGSVTFYTGSTELGTASLDAGGQATYTTSRGLGTYTFWAAYTGDGGNFATSDDSSSPLSETVMYAATGSLTTSNSSSQIGLPVQFTATVSAAGSTPGGVPAPTGSVTFEDGSTPISGPVPLTSGSATFSVSNLAAGNHTIAAVYSGDDNYAPSVTTVSQYVHNWNGFYELDGYGGIHAINSASLVDPSYWPGWDISRGIALDPAGAGGVVLDAWGGLHSFGDVSASDNTGYWPGWNIADAIAANDANQGYVLDGWGGLHPFSMNGASLPPAATGNGYWPGWYIVRGLALFSDNSGGVVLDAWGGVHPFGVAGGPAPAAAHTTGYWFNWDIARSIVLLPGSTSQHYGGYVLDGWGGIHPFGTAGDVPPPLATSGYWYNWDIARTLVLLPGSTTVGYVVDAWGGMHPVGGAPAMADPGYTPGVYLSRGAAVR